MFNMKLTVKRILKNAGIPEFMEQAANPGGRDVDTAWTAWNKPYVQKFNRFSEKYYRNFN